MQVDIAALCVLESAMPCDAIAMHAQGRYGRLLYQLILDSALVKATVQEITIYLQYSQHYQCAEPTSELARLCCTSNA